MTFMLNLAIVLISVIGMEMFAWIIHKYVMHGPGWGWHCLLYTSPSPRD